MRRVAARLLMMYGCWRPAGSRCGIAGEARYRLRPLAVPVTGATGATEDTGDTGDGNAAVVLFADRARQADPAFALTGESGRWWRRSWRGWTGCRWRSSWPRRGSRRWAWASCWSGWITGSQLLTGGDRTAAARQRSLAATVEWSYQLLSER